MSRKFPLFFAHHYLPELFFADPAAVVSDLFLEKKLAEAWKLGAEEMREFALKDGAPRVKPLFWRNHRVLLVEFAPALQTGEARAALLCWREGTKTAQLFYHEKADSGWAVTALGKERVHRYLEALPQGDSDSFTTRARHAVED